jgi:hypothetical protein
MSLKLVRALANNFYLRAFFISSKTGPRFTDENGYSPHSWTILEGENPRSLEKIRSPVFPCSRVHDVGRTLVVFPNKSEAFKLTMNSLFLRFKRIALVPVTLDASKSYFQRS